MSRWWAAAVALVLCAGACGPAGIALVAVGGTFNAGPRPPNGVEGIPDVLLDAYQRAAQRLEQEHPHCTGMRWSVLAGIGRVESDHAAGSRIDGNGDTRPPVIGPRLDGTGAGGNRTPHHDTDRGRWDGDTRYDRAVGVTQHLPATWAAYGVDGNDDGVADPHNVYDSTATTALVLCTGFGGEPVDFQDRARLRTALFRYNRSHAYVQQVLDQIEVYDRLTTAAAGARTPHGDAVGGAILEAAGHWLGTPYLYGGHCNVLGQDRCDCSSLVRYAYRHGTGIELPRTTYEQVVLPERDGRFTAIPADRRQDLRPGDMLFFGANPPGGIYHVGLYISDTEMLEAPRTGLNVMVRPWQGRDYYGAVGLR